MKLMWNAITALSLLVIAAIVIFTLYVATQILAFLQPLLLPVALAGVFAYLLEPVVSWLARKRMPRLLAVIIVFGGFVLGAVLLVVLVVPSIYAESVKFSSTLPGYLERGWGAIDGFLEQNLQKFPQLGGNSSPSPTEALTPTPTPEPPLSSASETPKSGLSRYQRYQNNPYVQQSLQYLQDQLPTLAQRTWALVQTSLTGVFGVFGFLVGLLIVPIYLFFFLKESPRIAESWSNYLPLRRSEFKDEVVTVLTEINGYLINFFRGQLVVAAINGIMVAIGLSIVGVQFGFLIGLGFAFIGIIPYAGYIVCYIPAILIAFAQFNDWSHPLWVTIIFFLIVAQIDGLVTTPRIVGNSVGLHPMTVIMSVFLWTLVLGGLLGAVLAIPLTATLKVLLHRYVWDRQKNIFFPEDIPTKDDIEIAT
jgi:predicted PurR-regulated permease PerM